MLAQKPHSRSSNLALKHRVLTRQHMVAFNHVILCQRIKECFHVGPHFALDGTHAYVYTCTHETQCDLEYRRRTIPRNEASGRARRSGREHDYRGTLRGVSETNQG